MQVKTSELNGNALDWAVAKCEKHPSRHTVDVFDFNDYFFNPSTDWSQGGPIIECEKLRLTPHKSGWSVEVWDLGTLLHMGVGKTPLIAAMRCYVASKFGDTVEIPDQFM
jgi:hypothetical protein